MLYFSITSPSDSQGQIWLKTRKQNNSRENTRTTLGRLINGSGLYMISQPSKRSRTTSFSRILAARNLERGQKIDEAGDGGASEGTLDVR